MVGTLMIGIVTGMAAAITALVSGSGVLAALGVYVLAGMVAVLAGALLALRAAEGAADTVRCDLASQRA